VCSVCGHEGAIQQGAAPGREGFRCPSCASSLRYRHLAGVIVGLHGREGSASIAELVGESEFADLSIYEATASGALSRYLSAVVDHVQSRLWTGAAPGEFREGVRCEDIERLTFQDQSFDLVITSDVFEHVRRPWVAFAEVARILRPGGRHLFTVPFHPRRATRPRLDVSEDGDLPLMPRRYHGAHANPVGSLVYTDFGQDLAERLELLGFETTVDEQDRQSYTFASRKLPAGQGRVQ
jgi:SAM-dependent methyltransferase